MATKKGNRTDENRFRPRVSRNAKTTATRLLGLCKSCGECVVKCPVKCISWDKEELGQLGDPAIVIDMEKCIGCETCEQICPDFAVEITNETKKPSD
jgi:2-oxoglutarate ferredoxin oxidoreductase subunit delta